MNEDIQLMVDVLDLSAAEAHVLRTFQEQMSPDPASSAFDVEYEEVTGFKVTRAVGRYVTASGQICVVIEGVGARGPITPSDPLHVGVRRCYDPGKHPNPHRVVDDHFVTLFPSDLREAPVRASVDVSQLISNYHGRHAVALLRNVG